MASATRLVDSVRARQAGLDPAAQKVGENTDNPHPSTQQLIDK